MNYARAIGDTIIIVVVIIVVVIVSRNHLARDRRYDDNNHRVCYTAVVRRARNARIFI